MTCTNPAFTFNGKREFVLRNQVPPFTYRLLFIISTQKLVVSRNLFTIIVFELLFCAHFLF